MIRSAFVVAFLAVAGQAFLPVSISNARPGSSLSMSAALIVQNKGGGHGELGT